MIICSIKYFRYTIPAGCHAEKTTHMFSLLLSYPVFREPPEKTSSTFSVPVQSGFDPFENALVFFENGLGILFPLFLEFLTKRFIGKRKNLDR